MKKSEKKDFEEKKYDKFGLDWDNISIRKAEEKIKIMSIGYDFLRIFIRKSSSGKGVHILVFLKEDISIREYFTYRLMFHDDFMRVAGSKKYTRVSIDLLFEKKIDEKKIMIFLEDAHKVRFWDLDEDGHGKNITVAGTMIKREKGMQFNDQNWQSFIGDKIRELIEEMSKNEKK